MSVSIHSLPRGFRRKALEKIIEKVLAGELKIPSTPEGKEKEASLVLLFLAPAKMAELNLRYRQKKGPTDVLSFSALEAGYLGEVIICPAQVRQNARRFKEEFPKELQRVLIHGVLHLLGYDHERGRQKAILMKKKEEYYSHD
ncbi:MAG: rRNA maturation RNase YbeY [bacterium]|nr:rRNA maturation RNase YbeY [bacterium]